MQAVNISHHGNETAVVLEGEDLWFCYETTVGEHHQLLPARETTASSIQFNIPRKAITVEHGKVKVLLKSLFNKPYNEYITAHIEVTSFVH